MRVALLVAVLGFCLASAEEPHGDQDFITQPTDVWVKPGETVHLDCELARGDDRDICAWAVAETHLGVDHFYNVYPPAKVQALFPEHERVCSIIIEQVDWRHDGLWTCWPLDDDGHIRSRPARVTVMGATTPYPSTEWPITTERPTTAEWPTTTEWPSTTEWSTTTEWPTTAPSTTPELFSTTSEMPSTTPEAPTTTVAPPTTGPTPAPGFVCPQPDGLFADPDNGRYFFFCKDGIAVHMQCEQPQRWDDAKKMCA